MYAIGKLKPFLTPRHRRTGLASVLALVGCLLAAPALAQVAGLCGPGKACSTTKLSVTKASDAAMCLRVGPGYDWGFNTNNSDTLGLWVYSAGTNCTAGGINLNYFTTNGATFSKVTSVGPLATGTAGAGTAFASFPSATPSGGLLFDATNRRWRQARLSAWVPFLDAASESQTIHAPLNAALNNPLNQWAWTYGNVGLEQNTSIFIDAAVVLTAGVGAGNAVYTVYDATGAAATSATVTVACTAAAGTVTSGSSDNTLRALPRNLQLRLTANGCSTLPVVNINVRTTAL